MPIETRHRSYCFTWNNYPQDLSIFDTIECRYVCYGKEVAPETGTPHLQGFISFRNAKVLSAVRRLLPGVHLSVARGTAEQNRTYCSKDGDFFERGDLPQSPSEQGAVERARWDLAWTNAKTGNFEDIPADIRIRCYTSLRRIRADYMPRPVCLTTTCGIWLFGESGSGKTRTVLNSYPEAYIKPRNNWWDGYQEEKVVLLDDVDKYDVALGGKLKHWADFCPFIAECKGASMRIRPEKLIVTSQYRIEDIWNDSETREALNRRFKFIKKDKNINIIL